MTDIYLMFFCGVEGLGKEWTEKLISMFGSSKAAYEADESMLRLVPDIDDTLIDLIVARRKETDPEREFDRLQKKGISFVSKNDPDFPERLLKIADCPVGLFYKGKLPQSRVPAIAVIGSRACTNYGRDVSTKFASELAAAGIDIVSGMAAGVDGCSHRGALRHGDTYAVLGTGVDVCYPPSNRDIYEEIPSHGGLISEYYPGTPARPVNFPRRNRLISGLSDGILVVEARERSGSWITVDIGLEQGRDIYAIPGRIDDPLSFGCNRLIRQGGRLVMSAADIIAELAPRYGFLVNRPGYGDPGSCPSKESSSKKLSAAEVKLLRILDTRPHSVSELAAMSGLSASEAMRGITLLEMRGLSEMVGPSIYVKRII